CQLREVQTCACPSGNSEWGKKGKRSKGADACLHQDVSQCYYVSVNDQATVTTIKIAKLTLSRRLQTGWMNNLRIRLPAKSHKKSNTTQTNKQISAFVP